MPTARKYRNRVSKLVIFSIGSRLKDNAFDLPVPSEIGHGFEPWNLCVLPENQTDSAELLPGAVRRSFKARNGKFESNSRLFRPIKKRPGFRHSRRSDKWVLSPVLSPKEGHKRAWMVRTRRARATIHSSIARELGCRNRRWPKTSKTLPKPWPPSLPSPPSSLLSGGSPGQSPRPAIHHDEGRQIA